MSNENVKVAADWPRDPINGRLLCAPEHPKPYRAAGQWSHTRTYTAGECGEGCCDDYACRDCDAEWRVEHG